MTTVYEIAGFNEISEDDDIIQVGNSVFRLTLPDSTSSISYTIIPPRQGSNGDDPPRVNFSFNEASDITIDGSTLPELVDALPEAGDYDVFFSQISWSGGVTYLLEAVVFSFDDLPGADVDRFYTFIVGGADFPFDLGTEAGREAFVRNEFSEEIISNEALLDAALDDLFGEATGAFRQGVDIPLTSFDWDSVTDIIDVVPTDPPVDITGTDTAEVIDGGTGNDRLDGLAGNDTLRGNDGADTILGGEGNDLIIGGDTTADLRDVVFAGNGNDSVDGGYGNDDLNGMGGNDTMEGGFGVDRLVGGDGDDVLNGGAFSDQIFGGDGFDFINGGFGSDRVNGGAGADRFFHVGSAGHGSDWVQDYDAAEGDVLVYGGGAATAGDFLVQIANTAGAGAAGANEAFITHIPSGNLLWALVDGDAQDQINIRLGGQDFDLLA